MKKACITLLVVTMICAFFTGCTQQKETEGSKDNGKLGGSLNYLSWMTKGEDEAIINGFMKENPDVSVELQAIDGTTYGTDVNTICLGGDEPDVFLIQPTMLNDLISNGYIQPIDGLKGVNKQAEVSPSVNEFLSRDGKLYGYAINGSYGYAFCYYNKAIFTEHNLNVPTTWEEFETLCQKLKDLGIEPMISPAGDTWNANFFVMNQYFHTIKNYGDSVDVELGLLKKEIKPSDVYRDMFTTMAKFKNNGWVSEGGLSMGWEAATQYFVDGKGAMICTGNWLTGSTPIKSAENFDYGCFVIPGLPGDDGKCMDAINLERILVLSSKSKNIDAAKALFEYFIREDVLAEYLTSQVLTGINITVPTDPVFDDALNTLKGDGYALDLGYNLPDMPTGWNNSLYQYSADALSGADVEQLLSKLDDEYEAAVSTVDVQKIIDKINK